MGIIVNLQNYQASPLIKLQLQKIMDESLAKH